MKNSKQRHAVRAGFTLIEIIAVLVIVGILAAVALPRYMDLTSEAEVKSLNAAFAEMKARVSLAYAKSILTNDGVPNPANYNSWADTDINLGNNANIRAAFTGFPGTWNLLSATTIRYRTKDSTDYVFTLNPPTATTDPPTVTVAPTI